MDQHGDTIPPVDTADLKAVWVFYKERRPKHRSGRSNLKLVDLIRARSSGADVKAVGYRFMLIAALDDVPDGMVPILASLKSNGEFSDAVITVASLFPMSLKLTPGGQPLPFDLEAFVKEVQKEQGV